MKHLEKLKKGLKLVVLFTKFFISGIFTAHLNRSAKRIYFLNWWDYSYEDSWFYKKLKDTYMDLTISSYKPDLVFCSVFGPRVLLNIYNGKSKRIFYTGENVGRNSYSSYSDHMLSEVELALGFEHIVHPRYIRLPLWLLYFTDGCNFSTADISEKITLINNSRSSGVRFCSMIASHDENGIRKK
jgi:alpha(1,3/1,4) fucosyltransferase